MNINVKVVKAAPGKFEENYKIDGTHLHDLLKDLKKRSGQSEFILSYDYGMDTTENDLKVTIYDYYVE